MYYDVEDVLTFICLCRYHYTSIFLKKIILPKTQTLQPFTINIEQKLFAKVVKNAKVEGLACEKKVIFKKGLSTRV
jgi:hypothetical protein